MGQPTPPTDPNAPPADPAAVPPTPVPTPPPAASAPPAPSVFDPATLPPEARDWLKRQQADAEAKARLGAKAAAAQAATDDVMAKIAAALGKAPGTVDPTTLTTELGATQRELRQLRVESAAEKAATRAGGDPDLVVAVLARQGKLSSLDPTSADFGAALDALVSTALNDNPRLRAGGAQVPAPGAQGASGQPFGAGPGTGPITAEQLAKMSPKEITAALEAGKLTHLM
jgi:hypothetical protein